MALYYVFLGRGLLGLAEEVAAAVVPSQPSIESAMALINGRWCRSGFGSQQGPVGVGSVFHRAEMLGTAFGLNSKCCFDTGGPVTPRLIVFRSLFIKKKVKKGMFLYSAVSSPLDRSSASHLGRSVHSDTNSASLGSILATQQLRICLLAV